MSPEAQRDLFFASLELPPAERESWLEEQCPDATARREILELINAHEESADFMDAHELPDEESLATETFPGFAVGELIGEGGHGEVYLAEEQGSIERQVALKVIRCAEVASPALRRFRAERQLLARLDHPGIARIFRAGTSTAGRPFFAMEYVPGHAITTDGDAETLDLRARVTLMDAACCAVSHAHQRGVIHGDIKPANILVSRDQDRALPRIIDFGIARRLGGEVDPGTQSLLQRPSGTPAYMSPEQADPRLGQVDTRTDVFGVGATLYEVLTGEAPYRSADGANQSDFLQRVRSGKVVPPSERVLTLEADRATAAARARGFVSQRALSNALRGDLDAICMRALAADQDARYPTVEALCDDLRNWLAFRPLAAREHRPLYVLSRWLRRHRVATAILVLVLSGVGFLQQSEARTRQAELDRAHAETRTAEAEAAERAAELELAQAALDRTRAEARAVTADTSARETADFLMRTLAKANPNSAGPELLVRDLLGMASQELDRSPFTDSGVTAALHSTIGRAYMGLGLFAEGVPHLEVAAAHFEATPGKQFEADTLRTQILTVMVELGREAEARAILADLDRRYSAVAATDDPARRSMALRVVRLRVHFAMQDGRLSNALDMCERALDEYRDVMADNQDHALLLILAAELQIRQGNVDRSIALLDQAVEGKAMREPAARLVLETNIARALSLNNRTNEAERRLRAVIPEMEAALGEDHPALTPALEIWAGIVARTAAPHAALPIVRRAKRLQERAGIRGRPWLLTNASLIAFLIKAGEVDEAESLLRESLTVSSATTDPVTHVVMLLRQLEVCGEKDDLAGARTAYEAVNRLADQTGDSGWRRKINSDWLMAKIEARVGDCSRALELSAATLESLRTRLDRMSPVFLSAERDHVDLLRQCGQHEAAAEVLRAHRAAVAATLPVTHSLSLKAWAAWSTLQQERDTDPGALAAEHRAMRTALEASANGSDDPDVLGDVGDFLLDAQPVACQDPEAAAKYLARAWSLDPARPVLGRNLSEALWRIGQHEEAITTLEMAIGAAAPSVAALWRERLKQFKEPPR